MSEHRRARRGGESHVRLRPQAAPAALPVEGFDHEDWVGRLREELEDLRSNPGGEDVFDDYRQRAHKGLAAIVGWLSVHPNFADGELTDPVHLLALALASPGGERHPIVAPASERKNGRPRIEDTPQRFFVQNILLAVRILVAGGIDFTAACKFMAREMKNAGHVVEPKTIEAWDGLAGSENRMGRAISAALDREYRSRSGSSWPPSKAEAECAARSIARSDHLKYLSWGHTIKT